MKLIRFVPSQPPYMAGETAGFDEPDAARYVGADGFDAFAVGIRHNF